MAAGVGPLGVGDAVRGHGERVAASVGASGDRGGDVVDERGEDRDALLGLGDLVLERFLVAVVGAFSALQAGELGVGFGFFHQERVAGGQGLDLVVGQGGVADVLDLADVEAAAHDLGDEPGLAFDGLPHVAVEGSFGDVSQDLDLGVVVALAQDAAFALGDVGGAPGAVEVVQGDGAELDVGADAHLLGAADQDGDGSGAAGGE